MVGDARGLICDGGGVELVTAGEEGRANGDFLWGEGCRGLGLEYSAGFGRGRGGMEEIVGGEGVGDGSTDGTNIGVDF